MMTGVYKIKLNESVIGGCSISDIGVAHQQSSVVFYMDIQNFNVYLDE